MALEVKKQVDSKESREDANKAASVEKLRRECSELIEAKDPNRQLSSKEDIEENRAWLHSNPNSQDVKQLEAFIKQYEKSVAHDKELLRKWDIKIQKMVTESLLPPKSAEEYGKWFREQKSEKKSEYLEKSDLDNPKRVKIKAEFEKLNKYFPGITLRKKFLDSNLEEREKLIDELNQKKSLLESTILPSIVKERLKHTCADSDLETSRKLIADSKEKHQLLKSRYLKLPPMVQEESRENFKEMQLDARAKWLTDIEQKTTNLTNQYRAKIKRLQTPNATGLTLFSNKPESTPGSSAQVYMNWFTKQLTLRGMETALGSSDLDKPERTKTCEQMAEVLKKMKPGDRAKAVGEFNEADLDARKQIIAHYNAGIGKEAPEKRGLLRTLMRRIFTSSKHGQLEHEVEAFAIGHEIAERRQRFQLAHHERENMDAKAHKEGKTDTLARTSRFEKAIHSEHLKDRETGKIKIRMGTLEAHTDDLQASKRALKPDVDNVNAQMTGDNIVLKTQSGDTVRDAREYKRGELQRQWRKVGDSAKDVLASEALSHGLAVTEKEITEALHGADQKEIAKEIIRKAAA